MFDSDVIKGIIAGWVRTLLAPAVIYLVANGYLPESDAVKFIAIAASLAVTAVWSLISKLLARKKVETALELPAGSSISKLNDVLESK